MNIQNSIASGRTNTEQQISQQTGDTQQRGRGNNYQPSQPPQFNNTILQLLLQLIVQLLQQLTQQPPEPQPESLDLTPNQQDNLKQLFNVDPNAPFSVQVLDEDGSGDISAGDTAILSGGITGGEVSRKTLSEDEAAQINQTKGNVPQAFTDNLQKWQSYTSGPDDFISYTTQQSCFCPQEFTRPMNITESDGQITSATYADTNEPVPDNIRQSLQTVDQRFEQLQNAYENGAATVNVEYDEQFGFPTSVFIDQSEMIADEEISYSISNLGIALP